MSKSIAIIIMLVLFSSCQKKRPAEQNVQQMDNYIPPASEAEIDTTLGYISPSDAFSDHSQFSPSNFQTIQGKFRGTRNIYYHIFQPKVNDLVIVVEYLNGARRNGDTTSTATRFLLYSGNELLYRKAFPPEFSDAVNFSTIQKFNYTVLSVNQSKSIVYYWFDRISISGANEKEYHAVSVDRDGITSELSGDMTMIASNFATVRFLNENRLKAKVAPNGRYPYLKIDLIFSIDWKICTSALDVPADSIFTVSDQPSRYFNSKVKLFQSQAKNASFHETKFKRLTQAQMQRIFIPSFFDHTAIGRDRLFIEYNRTTKGWIDYVTMKFEEIVSEN